MHVLRYAQPAREWIEALPIGNGLQGAMLFGGIDAERIQINEGTAWSGSTRSERLPPVVPAEQAADAVARARAALRRGDHSEADAQVRRLQHRYSQTFVPFADLEVRLKPAGRGAWAGPARRYARTLDLDAALHTVRYHRDGIAVAQTAFASWPDRVLVHRVRTDRPVDVSLVLSSPLRTLSWFAPGGVDHGSEVLMELGLLLQLPSDVAPPHEDVAEPITWDSREGAALRGAAVVGVRHDGRAAPGRESASVDLHAVTEVDIVIATATTFRGLGQEAHGDEHRASARAVASVRAAVAHGVGNVRRRQLADHRSLYRRTRWETPAADAVERTTDRLLLEANAGGEPLRAAPQLAPQLFHYGRYLMISASRRGGTPANLQGIWNQEMRPPWSANYTADINLQMNYWAADVADLPEVLPPLFDLVAALSRNGAETARRLYGARGWVAHHNTDVWAHTQPVGFGQHDPKWAFWPFAGAWLVRHLHDHLSFGARSADDAEAFAAEVVWPVTRAAAEFVLDWLIEEDDGSLGTAPSTSPENSFAAPDGATASVARSATMDLALAAELLSSLEDLAERLGRADDEVVCRGREALARIPGPPVAKDGTVQEWRDDLTATDPRHRHQSHLYPVYPGTGALSEELLRAASRSLDERGDDSTGWSLAWRVALRARLRQPEEVGWLLALFFRDMATDRGPWSGGLYPNLFAAHPPFQIDANFGFVAAVAECLVQSHDGRITLLPALPEEFSAGRIVSLVARPGIHVDIEWESAARRPDDRLMSVRLAALGPSAHGTYTVCYGSGSVTVTLDGHPIRLDRASFPRRPGRRPQVRKRSHLHGCVGKFRGGSKDSLPIWRTRRAS